MVEEIKGFVAWKRPELWATRSPIGLGVSAAVFLCVWVIALWVFRRIRFRVWLLKPKFARWVVAGKSSESFSLKVVHFKSLVWVAVVVGGVCIALVVSAVLCVWFAAVPSTWGDFRQKPLALLFLAFYLVTIITIGVFWGENQWSLAPLLRFSSLVPEDMNPSTLQDFGEIWLPQIKEEQRLRTILISLIAFALMFSQLANVFLIPFGECEGDPIPWMYEKCNATREALHEKGRSYQENYENDETWHVAANWVAILFNSVFAIACVFLIDVYIHAGVDLLVEVQARVAENLMRYGVNAHMNPSKSSSVDDEEVPQVSTAKVPMSNPSTRSLVDEQLNKANIALSHSLYKRMIKLPGMGDVDMSNTYLNVNESVETTSRSSSEISDVETEASTLGTKLSKEYVEKLIVTYQRSVWTTFLKLYGISLFWLVFHAVFQFLLTQRTISIFQAIGILMADSILFVKFFDSSNLMNRKREGHNFARVSRIMAWHVAAVLLLARIVVVSVPSNAWFVGQSALLAIAGTFLSALILQEYFRKETGAVAYKGRVLHSFRKVHDRKSLGKFCWLLFVAFLKEILFFAFFLYFGLLTGLLSSRDADDALRLGAEENSFGYVTVWMMNDAIPQWKIGVFALLFVGNFIVSFSAWLIWTSSNSSKSTIKMLCIGAAVMIISVYSAYFISDVIFKDTARFSIVGTVACLLPATFVGAQAHNVWVESDFVFWEKLPNPGNAANPRMSEEERKQLELYSKHMQAIRRKIIRRNVRLALSCVFVSVCFIAWGFSLYFEVEELDFEFAVIYPCALYALLCGVLAAQLWFNTLVVTQPLVVLFALHVSAMLVTYFVGLEEVITGIGSRYNDTLDVIGFFAIIVPVLLLGATSLIVLRDDHFEASLFFVVSGSISLLVLTGLGAWFALRFSAFAALLYYIGLVILLICASIWLWWNSTKLDADASLWPSRRNLLVVFFLAAIFIALGLWDILTVDSVVVGNFDDPLYGISYFIMAYILLIIFGTIFVLSARRDLKRNSTRLAPSCSLLGIPVIGYKVENRGGELLLLNAPVLWTFGLLFSMQMLGVMLSWTIGPNVGVSISSVAVVLMEIYALHTSLVRCIQFRGNLQGLVDMEGLDGVFQRILKESVDRCLQISQQAMMASWLTSRTESVSPFSVADQEGQVLSQPQSTFQCESKSSQIMLDDDAIANDGNNGDIEAEKEDESNQLVISSVSGLLQYYKDVEGDDAEYTAFLRDSAKYEALFHVLFWMRTTQVLLERESRGVGKSMSLSSDGSSKSIESPSSNDNANAIFEISKQLISDVKDKEGENAVMRHCKNFTVEMERVEAHSQQQPRGLQDLNLEVSQKKTSDVAINEHTNTSERNRNRSHLLRRVSSRRERLAKWLKTKSSRSFTRRVASSVGIDAGNLRKVDMIWKHMTDDEAARFVENVVAEFSETRIPWIDDDFRASNASLFLDWDDDDEFLADLPPEEVMGALWCRPAQIFPNCVSSFLARDIEVRGNLIPYNPLDILQGGTGDCWLLSAISVVALYPTLLDKVIVTKRPSQEGIYRIRLFLDGKWENILVDDLFPCALDQSLRFDMADPTGELKLVDTPPDEIEPELSAHSGLIHLPVPQYCRSRSANVFWAMLVEKAFAKRFGSYEALSGGHVHSALVDLTGGFSQVFSLRDDVEVVVSGALWDKLLEFHRRGALLAAGSPVNAGKGEDEGVIFDGELVLDKNGIVHGHAYAIVRVEDQRDYNGHHRLLQLRDPWGISRWKGRWSRHDKKQWTRRMQKRLGFEIDVASRVDGMRELLKNLDAEDANDEYKSSESDDGAFWISLEDFVSSFKWLYVCQIFDQKKWVHDSITDRWQGLTAGGPPNQEGARYNPQFLFRLRQPNVSRRQHERSLNCFEGKSKYVSVFISISNLQESQKTQPNFVDRAAEDAFADEDFTEEFVDAVETSGRRYPFMSLLLLDNGGKRLVGELAAKNVVASTGKYKDSRDLSLETKLPLDLTIQYTIFPSLFPRGEEGAFCINIYSETDFEVRKLPDERQPSPPPQTHDLSIV